MLFDIRRIGGSFVAEIDGIDLAHEDDPARWAAFHEAYLAHKVVIVRGQHFDAHSFAAFGGRFGSLEPHTVRMYRHPHDSGITILSNRVEMGRPVGIRDAGSWWHSDYSYKAVPANATILWAIEVPDEGGDTHFADLEAAWNAMPTDLQRHCEGRIVRQQYRWHRDRAHPEARWKLLSEAERAETPEVRHPLVRTHPETGRKSLYVSSGLTTGIIGIEDMDEAESDALLADVFTHVEDPQFHHVQRWERGMVVLWDNRSVMHKATTRDLPADRIRTLWRINTTGSAPF